MTSRAADERGRRGVLLVNLGTPASPSPRDVRRYLREFLSDPRVLDLPAPARTLLLYGVILPFRPRRSAEAYAQIWTPEGSPLLLHGCALADALGKELGDAYVVELAMRYGEPSIGSALDRLLSANVTGVRVVPLFPQYSSSALGSALEAVYREAGRRVGVPPLDVVEPFYDDPGFIAALARVAEELPRERRPDHLLMSFHGLPERQIRRADPTGSHCLAREDCCDDPGVALRYCYRAQCVATARALATALGLGERDWTLSFQSRLLRDPWIRPYTDEVLPELYERGVRRLAIACPAFVADCLETLEEIGIRASEQWTELGGESLDLVPCVNAHPAWVEALAALVRRDP
ncbi:MAG: ferrochelatase [Myxococcota bacterium]|nr:ferrochelatase [Myxococcota bacterium]